MLTRHVLTESNPANCAECGGVAHYRATPQNDLFFCTYACANDYAQKKAVRFSLKTATNPLKAERPSPFCSSLKWKVRF